MIRNQWYAILSSREVPKRRPVGVTRMGEKLVLWRDERGQVTCQADRCPHRGVSLSLGKVKDGCVQCPFHGFEFDPSGRCTLIPANGRAAPVPTVMNVHTYPAQEAYGLIYIWWGEPQPGQNLPGQVLPPVPAFDFMKDPQMRWAEIVDPWPVHYSRALENQLDVMHLPFIHHNTIGAGNKTVINGPRYTVDFTEAGHAVISVYVNNEVDRGQAALKASQAPPEPDQKAQVRVMMPNLWQNDFGEKMSLMIAFAPVDETRCLLYLRTYQKIITLPVLKELFFALSHIGNFIIERQDRRIVVTHQPSRSDLHGGEKLVQGDGPVIEYRKIRERLIQEAAALSPSPSSKG